MLSYFFPENFTHCFARYFGFLKQRMFHSCRTYFCFSKWGSLNSIAVRIRVKDIREVISNLNIQDFLSKTIENIIISK
jgi:hypothetical protein